MKTEMHGLSAENSFEIWAQRDFPFLFIFFSIAIKFFLFSFSCGIFADRHIHFTHTLYLPFLYGVHQISNEKLSVIAIFAMASVPVRFLCSGAPVSETNVIYND